jgi:hypothetical protein
MMFSNSGSKLTDRWQLLKKHHLPLPFVSYAQSLTMAFALSSWPLPSEIPTISISCSFANRFKFSVGSTPGAIRKMIGVSGLDSSKASAKVGALFEVNSVFL